MADTDNEHSHSPRDISDEHLRGWPVANLYELAHECPVEPADALICDACAAYLIAQEKETTGAAFNLAERRQFMDCRECHKLGRHTLTDGCILAGRVEPVTTDKLRPDQQVRLLRAHVANLETRISDLAENADADVTVFDLVAATSIIGELLANLIEEDNTALYPGPVTPPDYREAGDGTIAHELINTTDAQVWTDRFCSLFDGYIVGDFDSTEGNLVGPGTMIGWFANAIETGRNAGRKETCPHPGWTDLDGDTRICAICGTISDRTGRWESDAT